VGASEAQQGKGKRRLARWRRRRRRHSRAAVGAVGAAGANRIFGSGSAIVAVAIRGVVARLGAGLGAES
jgi:hypothetical protein